MAAAGVDDDRRASHHLRRLVRNRDPSGRFRGLHPILSKHEKQNGSHHPHPQKHRLSATS